MPRPIADLLPIAGQSNAKGRGNQALSPAVTLDHGLEVSSTIENPLDDPVLGAQTGSFCPALVNSIYPLSGRPVAICSGAVGGTKLLAESDPGSDTNWSPTGNLTDALIGKILEAWATLDNAGYDVKVQGIVWSQGEGDANSWPNGSATLAAAYEAALSDLVDRIQAGIGLTIPLWVIRTGRQNSADDAYYQAVRLGQDNAAANDPDIIMAYTDTVNFPSYGWMSDNVHYSQAGYNDIGTVAGPVIYSGFDLTPPSGGGGGVESVNLAARSLL